MVIMHSCDVKPCVNPNHLTLATPQENSLDMVRKERHGSRKLTAAKVQIILGSSVSSRKLGAIFGVSHTVIKAIRRREIWKHVNA
jgi:hypothetical protein